MPTNVKFSNSVKAIKYICKYVNKGSDQTVFSIERSGNVVDRNDDVSMYHMCHYISSNEAFW